jgi:hypothetical protein
MLARVIVSPGGCFCLGANLLKKRAADEERPRAVSLSDHWISRGMAGQLIQTTRQRFAPCWVGMILHRAYTASR